MTRIAIIANPISNISTRKFLHKFYTIMSRVADSVYIVNDGMFEGDEACQIIPATRVARKIKGLGNHPLISLLSFSAAQIGYSVGLLRCIRNIDGVVIFPITMFFPVVLGKAAGKKMYLYEAQDVYSDHTTSNLTGYLKFQLLWLCRKITLSFIDEIIIEGDHVVPESFRDRYSDKIRVCPQYVDGIYTMQKKLQDRQNNVGFIAFLERRKGALEFARAVHLVANCRNDIHFFIVGQGPLSDNIREVLRSEIESYQVTMIDSVPEEAFPAFLNELRLYVLPSLSEGLPNTVLEAMACGTPVLVTPVGAIPDIIRDKFDGFILNDITPECIAASIQSAIDNPKTERIVHQARSVISEAYTFERAIERYSYLFSK